MFNPSAFGKMYAVNKDYNKSIEYLMGLITEIKLDIYLSTSLTICFCVREGKGRRNNHNNHFPIRISWIPTAGRARDYILTCSDTHNSSGAIHTHPDEVFALLQPAGNRERKLINEGLHEKIQYVPTKFFVKFNVFVYFMQNKSVKCVVFCVLFVF